MISKNRGVARLALFIVAAASLTLLLPSSFNDRPPDRVAAPLEQAEPPPPPTFAKPMGAWRAKLGSLQDALRNFLARKTEPARRAEAQRTVAFRRG